MAKKKSNKENIEKIRILGIESSCDETAAAVIENGRWLISSVVNSQIELHKQFGGVFPEVASRQHIRTIHQVISKALQEAHMSVKDVDAIAVTRGPGLAGSLVVGMNAAKGLAIASGKPLIGINHMEGHIYSSWVLDDPKVITDEPQFPLIALLVSGGHSELILVKDHLVYERLGGTMDDAAGEAFDKVARLLSLPYPGGPSVQKASQNGDPVAFAFPRSRMEGTWNFSFSGVKTAVLRKVRDLEKTQKELPVEDLAASFQASVVDVLVRKTLQAADEYQVKQIIVAGGVSANKALRDAILNQNKFTVHIPPLKYCTDNAVMIAAAGYYRFLSGQIDSMDMDVLPTWPISRL
ncbi:MAG: tRNA (adenosine(37)-N6)-threonylcarbamoyltransferase complex transferase subunit TsaD [Anaerolineaceae bacterium]|nr:tRNA (adenosine(37)-N6)-threonylcarbamoyltransferase complex transferase subunit TsaD [Anaerolineaceae bacterium]